ncbi:hypothetical protein ASG87_10740 [Frateuria sp. Soil773]|uniref:hypothetical protein n=1 Tax=Frateuria sp. Soil773 TaxID=1736407 RepID=UPI0006F813A5|nr:hypothetical protein [Frateuria sp. Soil773]KRF01970.1 hypothetical protein ASG87_10740 [Frateuria sp. Soil773]
MTGKMRLALPWLLLVPVLLAALALRYLLIEPADMIHRCDGTGPWWCAWRQQAVLAFLGYGYGYAALAAAALALAWKHRFSAWLAIACGLVALQLYCVDAGAFAVLLGSLRLLRLQAAGVAPGKQQRRGEREVQPQP